MSSPSGGAAAKPIRRALIAALDATAPEGDRSKLQCVVDSLIGKAIDGDLAAIREIFDRVDGKVLAAAGGAGAEEPRQIKFEWKTDEP